MKIRDTRHETLDDYSIRDVTVRFEGRGSERIREADGSRIPILHPYLDVALKPEPYQRSRFESSSSEVKKHGAEALFIDCAELEIMVGALKNELAYCYNVLIKNKLLGELTAIKKEWPNLL
jgi:hypothetical protein